MRDETFRQIAGLMHEAAGLSFNAGKKQLVSSRLVARIERLGLAGFDDYAALISSDDDGGEFQMAVDLLTTNETYFFREPAHYDRLAHEFTRLRHPSQAKAISVWSAAASYGDEAYSTAMLLSDLQQMGRVGPGWSILGTDISERVLHAACEAIYPEDRLRNVTPERLKRYCLRGDGQSVGLVQIQQKLRDHVRFGQLNLCQPIDDIGMFDVVFLRNVLIYFDAQTKSDVVDSVLTRLKPGGLFFTGIAEGRVTCTTPLESLSPGAFRKPV